MKDFNMELHVITDMQGFKIMPNSIKKTRPRCVHLSAGSEIIPYPLTVPQFRIQWVQGNLFSKYRSRIVNADH